MTRKISLPLAVVKIFKCWMLDSYYFTWTLAPVHLGALGTKHFTWALWLQRHAELPTGPWLCLTPSLPHLPLTEVFAVENFPVPAWQLCWRLFLFLPWQHPVVWPRHLLSAGVSLKVMHGACSAALQECKIPCSQNPLLHLVPAFVSWSLSATSVAHSYIIKTWN